MITVFLSASVPRPDRAMKYFRTGDVIAIRDSVKALVSVIVPKGTLVFGGHPAITPLVRQLIRDMKRPVRQHVVVYQSDFYKTKYPPEIAEFERVVIVPAVGDDEEASKKALRERMLRDYAYDAAFFIGGMEGVEEEFALLRERQPRTKAFPVASTGAAAGMIFGRERFDPALEHELAYPTLFRGLLGLD